MNRFFSIFILVLVTAISAGCFGSQNECTDVFSDLGDKKCTAHKTADGVSAAYVLFDGRVYFKETASSNHAACVGKFGFPSEGRGNICPFGSTR